jgi:hypothetical protein
MKVEEAVAIVRACVDEAEDEHIFREIDGEEVIQAVVPLEAARVLLEGYTKAVELAKQVSLDIDGLYQPAKRGIMDPFEALTIAAMQAQRLWDICGESGPEPGGEGK